MKPQHFLIVCTSFFLVCPLASQTQRALPESLKVFVNQTTIANRFFEGSEERTLLIANRYRGDEGVYIACYSHEADGSSYAVGERIYVMGLIRVWGTYEGRIARPKGFESADISAERYFQKLCNEHFPATKGGGWAGGDTGGFFGHD